MTPRFARFSGLLALCLVVACDSGADAKPKSSKAPASKAASAKAGGKKTPAKAKTREVAKATPTSTDPAGASAVRPSGEPTSTPSDGAATPSDPATPTAEAEPTAIDPATPTAEADPAAADPATPTAEAEPTAIDPAADPAADPDAESTTPTEAEPGSPVTATGAELTTPIPLGPDAELLRLVLAHGMENRQPVDPATTFAEGTRVNLFIESRNEGEEPLSVRVTWENVKTGRRSPPTGVVIGKRKLHRTRAYRTMRKAGSFKAIVLDADDQELAVLPFTIE